MRRFLLLLVIILPALASAQSTRWKKMRHEFIIGGGAANVLGDLGGANRNGTHLARDLEYTLTRMNGCFAYRYRLEKKMYIKTGFFYGRLLGDDKKTQWDARENRNLSFKSNVWEFSSHFEYTFNRERDGHHYNIKHVHGWRSIHILSYGFLGIGVYRHNPTAVYNGQKFALQPLHTEGQGLPGGPKQYKRVGVCIPVGLGAKYSLGKKWTVGIEYGIRKTFTDYLDDVSTKYYDKEAIRSAYGDVAAALSNPANPEVAPNTGDIRGNPKWKDSYMFALVTVGYKYSKGRKTKAKF